jgi:hypothetical protein
MDCGKHIGYKGNSPLPWISCIECGEKTTSEKEEDFE